MYDYICVRAREVYFSRVGHRYNQTPERISDHSPHVALLLRRARNIWTRFVDIFLVRPTPHRIFKYPHFSNARDETLSKEAFVIQCGKRGHEHFLSFVIRRNQRKSPPSATLVSKEERNSRSFLTFVKLFPLGVSKRVRRGSLTTGQVTLETKLRF